MTTLRIYIAAALLAVLLAIGGWLYWKGGHDKAAKIENKALHQEAKDVAASNATSRDTQRRVDVEGAQTRDRTQEAQEAIRDRIQARPVADGPADPDVLRIATEAYQRALRAACRVQRTSGCAEASAAAGQ